MLIRLAVSDGVMAEDSARYCADGRVRVWCVHRLWKPCCPFFLCSMVGLCVVDCSRVRVAASFWRYVCVVVGLVACELRSARTRVLHEGLTINHTGRGNIVN